VRKLREVRPRRGVRRGIQWFAVAVLALLAAVFLVPGIARADTPLPIPTLPAPPGGDPIGGIVGGLTGNPPPAAPPAPADPVAGQPTQQDTATSGAPSGLPPLDPSQLAALFQALGIPAGCSAAVQQDLEQLIGDIPTTVQQIGDQIISQLPTGGGLPGSPLTLTDPQSGATILMKEMSTAGAATAPTFSSPDPSELPVVTDLQQLVTDLQQKCAPAPQTSTPPPPPPSGNQPQQPVQAAAPPVAQPVSYPGYAPTGSIVPQQEVRTGGEVPLAALGGVLVLVSGAAVTATRLRTRAARDQA
jgi:hypothetical protein